MVRIWIVLVLLCVVSEVSWARNVKGIVSDESGLPLGGVAVRVLNTTKGMSTGLDGKYSLEVVSGDILSFSFVGFKTQEVSVASKSQIDVTLHEEAGLLDEVVVVGYQTQKKVNLSGAVDNLKAEDMAKRPITSLSQGLQGVSPNLNIDFSGGAPGANAKINIRGFTSINGGDPLVLIDGIPSGMAELNRIPPSDVESISVLKDASSAAIYGARAAFGVILITTKSGRNEKLTINYSANMAWGKPTVLPDKVTDPYIYLRLRETSTDNTPWDNQNYSDETYAWAKQRSDNPSGTVGVRESKVNPGTWEYMGNKDWTNYFLDGQTFTNNQNLSISGRSNKLSYYLSGSYSREKGLLAIADDYFERYGVRSKLFLDITDWLKIGNNTYLSRTNEEKPSGFNLQRIYNLHPVEWAENPDGTWANTTVGRVAAQLKNGGKSKENAVSIQTTFNFELKLLPKILKINGDYTIERDDENENEYYTKYNIGYGPKDIREEGESKASMENEKEDYHIFNIYGTFTKIFDDKHSVSAILGYNQEHLREQETWFEKSGLVSASLPTVALATGKAEVGEDIKTWAVRGGFLRLNYIYDEKYILELNGRYDGTSRFPKSKRFGFFPSTSLAWNVHKEGFMRSFSNVLSLFKLRASYGKLGNQSSVAPYGYLPTMSAYKGRYIMGGKLPQRVAPSGLVSPNYTWETVSSRNIGVDLGFFDNKLLCNFDVYRRDTKGMLIPGKEMPAVLGANEPYENAGDLKTEGWELSLAYRGSVSLMEKPFNFRAKFVLSDNKSFITRFDNPTNRLTQFYEGMQLGEIWGLESDGLFKNQGEIDKLDQSSLIPWGALKIVPGWPKYKDLDGNGKIEKGNTVDAPKDLKVIGNRMPRYRYAIQLSCDWNGFDASVFLQGVGKRDYYPLDYLYWGFYQQPYAGGYKHLLDFYRAENDSPTDMSKHSKSYIDAGLASQNLDSKYPVLQSWLADRNLGERIDQSKGLAIPQTRYLLNAAYLRLKNITIGYSLPQRVVDKLHLSNVRFYITGENLIEWSAISKYFDPEAISDDVSKLNPAHQGVRGTASGFQYPFQRKIAFGLNVTF